MSDSQPEPQSGWEEPDPDTKGVGEGGGEIVIRHHENENPFRKIIPN